MQCTSSYTMEDTSSYTMEEDINSVKKCNHQSCKSKEKPGIRKLFRNAWRRMKIVSGGSNRRESDNDDTHLYRKYSGGRNAISGINMLPKISGQNIRKV
ncbi:PREDICTED: uncharacterized protein LOC105568004 isoform X2 [Vollenhovia emeryi]|uniref:uncharacterized protein LOC105568004 isoform X2 n=1 Tax=Vollenhovia emeryi TaxID=411798 RepID=UPI0005F53429|nr:PREDICTED: uncharacterized protein LOC105568004 isoform X2 [Vollenhovia emeryi]